jgi:hypothetical protein
VAIKYTTYLTPGWDSWAVSVNGLPGPGYFEFSFNAPSGAVCGISPVGISEQYLSIQFGFYVEGNSYSIMESGAQKTSLQPFSGPGARFRVQRKLGVIEYFLDDNLVYSTEQPEDPYEVVHLYASLYQYSEKIENPVMFDLSEDGTLDIVLPPYASFSTTDIIDGLTYAELPPLFMTSESESGIFCESALPPVLGMSSSDDVAMLVSQLPALDADLATRQKLLYTHAYFPPYIALSSSDHVCLIDATLPAIHGEADQRALIPNVCYAYSAFPAINGYMEAGEAILLSASFPGYESFSIGLNEDEVGDVAFVAAALPQYKSISEVKVVNYLIVKIPLPFFAFFGMQDYIASDLFSLQGQMFGFQTGGWVEAAMPELDGAIFGGGWIASAIITGLEGTISGSVVVAGNMSSALPLLDGELLGAGTIDSVLTTITGDISGFNEFLGRISGPFTSIEGSIDGNAEYSGSLFGEVATLSGEIYGMAFVNGGMAGEVITLAGRLEGATDVSGQIEGAVLNLIGIMSAGPQPTGSIDEAVFRLAGHLSAAYAASPAQCITMKYSRQ